MIFAVAVAFKASLEANFLPFMGDTYRATDFLRLQNRGRNNGIRHLKRNPYSVKITITSAF